MSDHGRQQFTWPQGGEPRAAVAAFSAPPPPADGPPADAFCLVYMDVDEVDHVLLRSNERLVYRRQGSGGGGDWSVASVNP